MATARKSALGTTFIALAGLASCTVTDGRVDAGFIQTTLSGDVALDSSGGGLALGSIKNDIDHDLGVDDDSPSLFVGGNFSGEWGRISASAFKFDESGSGTLTNSFGDLPAGSTVSTDVEFTNLKAIYTYDVFENEYLRIAPGVGLDLFLLDVDVNSSAPFVAFESVEVDAPVPMAFLCGELELDRFGGLVEAGAMSGDFGDGDGTYFDIEGRLTFRPHENVEFFGGYRYISINADGEADSRDFDSDLEIQGWFVGGALLF